MCHVFVGLIDVGFLMKNEKKKMFTFILEHMIRNDVRVTVFIYIRFAQMQNVIF